MLKRDSLVSKNDDEKIQFTALVRNQEQLAACLKAKINKIYLTDDKLYQEYSYLPNIYFRLPRVISHHPNFQQQKLLVGETGSIWKYQKDNQIVSDYYLNVTNSYTVSYFRKLGVTGITLSVENSVDTIKKIVENVGNSSLEVIVFGRLEAMIMKYCPLKMLINHDKNDCQVCRNGRKYAFQDRNGEKYPLLQENELTHLFYYQNLNLESVLSQLKSMGISRFRFEFFDENAEVVEYILKKFQTMLL